MTPDLARLMDALEATWPPAETARIGGWRVRRGQGGGSRVSSVRPVAEPCCALGEAIARAEDMQRAWGQTPLFQMTEADAALDAELATRGYATKDPTVFMAASAADLAGRDPAPVRPVEAAAPLAAMEAIWATDGVGSERLAVMARASQPKTHFALRLDDRICGVAFVAVDREMAMLHALVTDPGALRRGCGDSRATMARTR